MTGSSSDQGSSENVTPERTAPSLKTRTRAELLASVDGPQLKKGLPSFRPGDTVKVHVRIVEGTKERIQAFEGVVIRRSKGNLPNATFTVRKISYNVGVERTFLLHSPRLDKIELIAQGIVRRARLFYLRDTVGKASRIRRRFNTNLLQGNTSQEEAAVEAEVSTAS